MNFERLRQLLLEQAIRGKLVLQLESEPKVDQIDELLKDVPFTIPEKWKWTSLGAVSKRIHYGYTTSAKEKGNARLLRITDIQNGMVNWASVPYCFLENKEIAKFRLAAGDLVIARTGGTIGKSFLITEKLDEIAVFASYLIRVIPDKLKVNPGYLLRFLDSPCYWKQLSDNSRGTGQPNVNAQALSEIKVPLPPIEEQNRIVEQLNKLFDLIDCAEKAYNELSGPLFERFRQLCLEKAIQGKLVPQLESEPCIELPDSQLSDSTIDIPKKWKWVKLKDIFTFIDYRGKTPNKIHEGVRLITASNIKQGRMDHSKKVFISNEEYLTRQSRGISKKGDILFTTEAPLGNVAIADIDNYSAGQRIITLQSKKGNNKLYMYFMLSPYFQKLLVSQATGTTAQGIKAARLKELVIPVPPEGEQERILNKLTALFSFLEIYK